MIVLCDGIYKMKKENDKIKSNILSVKYPEIAKWWDYDKNGDMTPEDVTYGSGRTVYWKCEEGHGYPDVVRRQLLKKFRCPKCKKSQGAKIVDDWLVDNIIDNFVINREYIFKKCKNKRPLPFDFAIFNKDDKIICLIEYDGEQHWIPKSFGSDKSQKTKN